MDEAMRRKVEERAYQLFLERGGVHGYHIEDWVKAEQEVSGGAAKQQKAAAPRGRAKKA